ncbi:MAG: hypothetical protein WA901_18515 [Phormidesmis sp.]
MANDFSLDLSAAEFNASSLALLALKRLARRTFRQVGIALVSLIVVLNLTGQPTAHDRPLYEPNSASVSQDSWATLPAHSPHRKPSKALSSKALSSKTLSKEDSSGQVAQKPYQTLRHKLTHHRVTTARLAVPTLTERVVANLAKDE